MAVRITLRQLEYLVAVGELGSIALAAERLNVSSPSISAAITHVELDYGVQLFVRRHAQGLSLTHGGRQFCDQARTVLGQVDRLKDLANSITQKVQGSLNVGCLVTFAQVVLPQLRRGFVDRYPDVEFRQYERTQTDLFAGLRTASLDVALGYDLDIPKDLEFVPLVSLSPYAVMHQAHALADRAAVSPADLAAFPMILLDLPLSVDYFLSAFTSIGLRPNIVERTRDMAVMQSLVGQGFGYSIANIRPWSDRAPDGSALRFVPLSGPMRPMQLGVLLAEGARFSMTVKAFVEHCQQTVSAQSLCALRSDLPAPPPVP